MVLSLPWYTASPPDGVRLLYKTEEHDKDIVTYEHRVIVIHGFAIFMLQKEKKMFARRRF